MIIDELLYKLGIKADLTALKEFASNLEKVENSSVANTMDGMGRAAAGASEEVKKLNKEVTKTGEEGKKSSNGLISGFKKVRGVATLVFGVLSALSFGLAKSFANMFKDVDKLAQSKSLLFKISEKELAQAKEYNKNMERAGLVIQSLKVRVGLGLLPVLNKLVMAFEQLTMNSEGLVSQGLIAILKVVVTCVEAVLRFIGAVDNVVSSTVKWKNLLLALGLVFGGVKRKMILAFIIKPITLTVLAIIGLILLIDDLIVYLKGGKSAFGGFWKPAIEWCKKVWNYIGPFILWLRDAFFSAIYHIIEIFGSLWDFVSNLFDIWGDDTKSLTDKIMESFAAAEDFIIDVFKNALGFILSLFGLTLNDVFAFIDEAGKAFSKVTDLIKEPFAAAFDWVMSAYDKTIGKVMSGLGWIGKKLGMIDDVPDDMGKSALSGSSVSNHSINNRAGDVNAQISVTSPDPLKAGESVRDALAPAYARANNDLQGMVDF